MNGTEEKTAYNYKSQPCLKKVVWLLFLIIPLISAATGSIYTVQTGSFTDLKTAEKQFELLQEKLTDREADFLRVEKIGKFYTVRLGKFEDESSAHAVLVSAKTLTETAILMNAYFKVERIIKIYPGDSKVEAPISKKQESHETAKPLVQEEKKAITKTYEKPQRESLQILLKEIANMVADEKYEKALKIIQAEMARRPEEPDLYGWYGTVLLKLNDPAEALKYFIKASELSPKVPDFHNGEGYSLYYLKKFNEAIHAFNQTLSLDPRNLDALVGLGIISASMGKTDESTDFYNRLQDIDKETAGELFRVIQKTSY